MTPSGRSLPPCVCGKSDCDTPYGYCHCGCGEKTPLASRTHTQYRHRKGQPLAYISYHQNKVKPQPEDAVPFKIVSKQFPNGVYCRLISLSQNQFTVVTASRYPELMTFNWYAQWAEKTQSFYAVRKLLLPDGRRVILSMQRHILGLGPGESLQGDHHNRVTLDNRDENIRNATSAENGHNSGIQKNNTSGVTGVGYRKDRGMWRSFITVNRVRIDLGSFYSFTKAVEVRKAAEIRYFGEFKVDD